MKQVFITCDFCGDSLGETRSMPKYRLKLSSEAVQNVAPSEYYVKVRPFIREEKHFCGLDCLKQWVNAK